MPDEYHGIPQLISLDGHRVLYVAHALSCSQRGRAIVRLWNVNLDAMFPRSGRQFPKRRRRHYGRIALVLDEAVAAAPSADVLRSYDGHYPDDETHVAGVVRVRFSVLHS